MKAIRVREFGGPEVLRVEEVSEPEACVGEVLVAVAAVGVNPVDTYIRSGNYGLDTLPYTPGFDAAGVVEAVGDRVHKFKAGDRVYTSGTVLGAYAEKVVCDEGQVHMLPAKVSFAQGAALGVPYSTAYRGLFQRGCAKGGEVVLVHGASGGVGIASIQLARAAGMVVIGTAGTDEGCELVLKEGATHAVKHCEVGYMEKVMELTTGRGVDVVLEMLANVNLGRDLEVMAMGGRVVVIGCRGMVEINPRLTMKKDVSIVGMLTSNARADEMSEIHRGIDRWLEDGSIRPVVGLELPLAEAARAHREVIESRHLGKIVLICRS